MPLPWARTRTVFGVLAAIIAALLFSACSVANLPGIGSQSTGAGAAAPGRTVVGKTRGDPNAAINFVVFSDFQ